MHTPFKFNFAFGAIANATQMPLGQTPRMSAMQKYGPSQLFHSTPFVSVCLAQVTVAAIEWLNPEIIKIQRSPTRQLRKTCYILFNIIEVVDTLSRHIIPTLTQDYVRDPR